MKVTIASDFPRDDRLGSGKIPIREAEALRRLGVEVREIFMEDLPPGGTGRTRLLTAPLRMASALTLAARDSDVVDVAGFDAWMLFRSLRLAHTRRALVTRTNGLWYKAQATQRRFQQRNFIRNVASDVFQTQVLARWERDSIVQADLARTLSGPDRDAIIQNGWKPADRVVTVNPAPDSVFADTDARGVEGRSGVVSLGSWLRTKGSDTLGAAVDHLLRSHPELTFVAAGVGVPVEQVLAAFDPSVHARVTVIPKATPQEMARVADRAAIMVFPSLYEGFGLVTVEAMRAGLAVVTTPTGAGADMIRDGHNGLLVPPEDGAALEAAVERLLGDPALRIRLAHQAREDAMRHNWDEVAAQLLNAYLRAIELASERVRH